MGTCASSTVAGDVVSSPTAPHGGTAANTAGKNCGKNADKTPSTSDARPHQTVPQQGDKNSVSSIVDHPRDLEKPRSSLWDGEQIWDGETEWDEDPSGNWAVSEDEVMAVHYSTDRANSLKLFDSKDQQNTAQPNTQQSILPTSETPRENKERIGSTSDAKEVMLVKGKEAGDEPVTLQNSLVPSQVSTGINNGQGAAGKLASSEREGDHVMPSNSKTEVSANSNDAAIGGEMTKEDKNSTHDIQSTNDSETVVRLISITDKKADDHKVCMPEMSGTEGRPRTPSFDHTDTATVGSSRPPSVFSTMTNAPSIIEDDNRNIITELPKDPQDHNEELSRSKSLLTIPRVSESETDEAQVMKTARQSADTTRPTSQKQKPGDSDQSSNRHSMTNKSS